MFLSVCTLKLHIYDSHCLKDKRNVIKSIIHKIRLKYNVSIAEVGCLNALSKAEIGIACVGNSVKQCSSAMDRIIHFIDSDFRVEIIQIDKQIL